MGLFNNVLNQIKNEIGTITLSPEEKRLDTILKDAAKDAFVKLIQTDKKNIYDIDVTLANGKSISSYGSLSCEYGLGDEPYFAVKFLSVTFDISNGAHNAMNGISDWKHKGGEHYSFWVMALADNRLTLFFDTIPVDPEEHEEFKYDEIAKRGGVEAAEKRFCEFLSKKISGYITEIICAIEYSISAGHKWPCELQERRRAYPDTMKRILTKVAESKGGKLTPQSDEYHYLANYYKEGKFYFKHSPEYDNPTVTIEFISFPYEDGNKATHAGEVIAGSSFAKGIDVFLYGKNELLLKKTVTLQDVDVEEECIECLKNAFQDFIEVVVNINNMQKWPTCDEVAARREEEARKAAEEERRKRELEQRIKTYIAADVDKWMKDNGISFPSAADRQSTPSYNSSSSSSDSSSSAAKEEADRKRREAENKKREAERIKKEKEDIREKIEAHQEKIEKYREKAAQYRKMDTSHKPDSWWAIQARQCKDFIEDEKKEIAKLREKMAKL